MVSLDQNELIGVIELVVALGHQAITWAYVDPDLSHHMVLLDQKELIGVIELVLQDIH